MAKRRRPRRLVRQWHGLVLREEIASEITVVRHRCRPTTPPSDQLRAADAKSMGWRQNQFHTHPNQLPRSPVAAHQLPLEYRDRQPSSLALAMWTAWYYTTATRTPSSSRVSAMVGASATSQLHRVPAPSCGCAAASCSCRCPRERGEKIDERERWVQV
jgi:hypothetical protein